MIKIVWDSFVLEYVSVMWLVGYWLNVIGVKSRWWLMFFLKLRRNYLRIFFK